MDGFLMGKSQSMFWLVGGLEPWTFMTFHIMSNLLITLNEEVRRSCVD
jgi:hypothetical protein